MNIRDLYEKTEDFLSQQSEGLRSRSMCKKGCSRCCYTDISVFELEAQNIENWYLGLPPEEHNSIQELWKTPANDGACTFLRSEACTIYQARPLICRTQGLALKFKLQNQPQVDICPLNESMLEIIQEKEILNLDLLNQILSRMEYENSKQINRPRVPLTEIKNRLSR